PLFDHGQFRPGRQQRLRAGPGLAYARGDLAFLEVADRDRGVAQGLPVVRAGLVRVLPEHGTPVQVADGGAGPVPGRQRVEGGRPARLLARTRTGDPEHLRGAYGGQVQLAGAALQVWRP